MDRLNKYVEEANLFFKDVAAELGNPEDTARASRVTVAFFHTLRERLSPSESMHVISQLPMILKGMYVDGWKMHESINKVDTLDEFLDEVRDHSPGPIGRDFGDHQQTRENILAVISVLRKYVDEGEMRHIRTQLPEPIAELFE
jgi:uncharacterized protein (DUF2267 family)